MQEVQNARFGNSVKFCLVSQNVDLQVRRVIEQIRVHEKKSRELVHLLNKLSRGRIDFVRIDAGNRISKLSLQVRCRAGADLEHGLGLQKGDQSGNAGVESAHQLI